ncbi:MAG: radical SAM protein [Firmicutes bacterium]|nr:radical SAM protein [Bacillota bacterium]
MDKTILKLNEEVAFVSGAKGGAIYDFNSKMVYLISSGAQELLGNIANGQKDTFDEAEKKFLNELEKASLISSEKSFSTYEFPLQTPPRLSHVWLELAERCNEKCIHCYVEAVGQARAVDTLAKEKWKTLLAELSSTGCKSVQFIGGEPLLFDGVYELLEYAKILDFESIALFTNAVLLNEERVQFLKKNGIHVSVSLYGHNAEIHDAITQIQGSFDKTVENLKILKHYGVPVSISVIIMQQNQDYVTEIKSFIKSMGFKYNGYDVIRPLIGGPQQAHIPTSRRIINSCFIKKAGFRADKKFFENALSNNTCWSGKFAITSSGKVIPCIFSRNLLIGDVNEQSIADILNSDELSKYWKLTKESVKECSDCEYRFCCKDCRPLGMSVKGDLFGKSNRCAYDPNSGKWKRGGYKKE